MVDSERDDHVVVECRVCLQEVPRAGAISEEACDYVAYYCGLECYQLWLEKTQKNSMSSDDRLPR